MAICDNHFFHRFYCYEKQKITISRLMVFSCARIRLMGKEVYMPRVFFIVANFYLFLVFLFPAESLSSCVCVCMNGENQPLCSSTLDIPPVCPPKICPIEPPSIEPIQPPSIPPIGTQNCWMEQVFNEYTQQYEWRQVCR